MAHGWQLLYIVLVLSNRISVWGTGFQMGFLSAKLKIERKKKMRKKRKRKSSSCYRRVVLRCHRNLLVITVEGGDVAWHTDDNYYIGLYLRYCRYCCHCYCFAADAAAPALIMLLLLSLLSNGISVWGTGFRMGFPSAKLKITRKKRKKMRRMMRRRRRKSSSFYRRVALHCNQNLLVIIIVEGGD